MEILGTASSDATPAKRQFPLLGCCRGLLAVVALMVSLGVGDGMAKAEESLEYAVKGAFLFKFGAYVEWPSRAFPDAATPFVIGILGEDPFGAKLDEIIQDRMVHGRPVVIKYYKQADQARGAHILYLSRAEAERLEQIVASLRGASILTVSDESLGPGGIINFVVQENKVRFEIDRMAADRAGLKVSSKLLSLAKVVDKEKQSLKK